MSPRLIQQLRTTAQNPATAGDAGVATTHSGCGVCALDSRVSTADHTRTTHGPGRKPHTGVARSAAVTVVAITVVSLAASQPAVASTYEDRIRTAPVTWAYSSALSAYTGGSYGVDTVNQLWPRFPRRQTSQRAAMLKAARKYGVPLRLLMGVYGMESGFGRYRCYFGLTGYFPGTGTSGSFSRDAMLSAGIFRRLLGRHMVR